jgi:DNA-binding response OmpR family regulator
MDGEGGCSHRTRQTAPGNVDGAVGRAHEAELGLRRRAERGVESLTIRRHLDGHATVKIGEYPELELPPALTDLLEALCAKVGEQDGDLIPYKRVDELVWLLRERREETVSSRSVVQRVYRLRETLKRDGNNRYLVQTSRSRGYRLALRRHGKVVT